jgi:hypothetical protein
MANLAHRTRPSKPEKPMGELTAAELFAAAKPDFRSYRPPTAARPNWSWQPAKAVRS